MSYKKQLFYVHAIKLYPTASYCAFSVMDP